MKAELWQKVDQAIDLMRKGERLALTLSPEEGYCLAFSGGKDSLAVYGLAKLAEVKFTPWYCVTGNDSPDTVYYIRRNFPDVKFYHPKKKFIQLVRQTGMPTMQRRFCCERLKERSFPGRAVLLGVRAEESRRRAKYTEVTIWSRRVEHKDKSPNRDAEWLGQVTHDCIKGQDQVKVNPIFYWSTAEVWTFIAESGLPVNPEYDRIGRVGCMFCPFASAAQIEMYEMRYPRFAAAVKRAAAVELRRDSLNPFESIDEYWEWWKSKKSLQEFRRRKRQLELLLPSE